MENEESKSRIIEKTQLKRETFRVLGRPVSDLHNEKDVQIYNDFDFYKVLLADFLQSNDIEGDENGKSRGCIIDKPLDPDRLTP